MVEPDNKAAVEFLCLWAPDGPWVLTAIKTDRKSIDTGTFYPGTLVDLERWLKTYNGQRNIYFQVNSPLLDLQKKAKREEMKSMDWLHVDIDPRAGEDLEEERVRALALLQGNLPEGVPAPTCIVFSGGGYQGFWKLQEAVEIDGVLELAEDAKRYNMQLELLFGADNCHNVDRIMRLPGTINIPDARKIKKGRVPALARLVEFTDNVYPITDFVAAPAVQMGDETMFGGGEAVQISGNVERIDDVSELDAWNVPDRVKIVMAQGRHPDQAKEGDNSRSAWLFDFCCQMVRHEVPDDVIFSIITDPTWGISDSVLELKGRAERYAIKQIESAKLFAIDPKLVYFNNKYAVIKKLGGKCLVVTDMYDYAMKRSRLVRQTLENFEKGYENEEIVVGIDTNGNPKTKPAGTWWRKHKNRRQYETIVFAPEQQVPADHYNLWKGFAVQSIPGDCQLFIDHVCDNICGGVQEYFDYLMGWMARAVQEPATAGEVAIVLRGGRGVGKSFFAKQFGSLFGRHFMQVSNSSHLVGNFNSHLRDLLVLFADEAFYAGDRRHESVLKTLITEETMAIEAKGVDIESSPNYIHLIMASNDMHVIPAGGDERRFFVLDVSTAKQQDGAYFRAIADQMDNKGREALLHLLLTYDRSNFSVYKVPRTEALQEQKLLSLGVQEAWWLQKLTEGRILESSDGWDTQVSTEAIAADYIEHTKRFNVTQRGNQVTLGKFLNRLCPRLDIVQKRVNHKATDSEGWTKKRSVRMRFYMMPELDEARQHWDMMFGAEEWEPVGDQIELPVDPQTGEPPF